MTDLAEHALFASFWSDRDQHAEAHCTCGDYAVGPTLDEAREALVDEHLTRVSVTSDAH